MSIEATERYLRTEATRSDGRQTCRVDKSALSALLDELSRLREALKDIATSDDIDNALDPARNKRVAARALSEREGQE